MYICIYSYRYYICIVYGDKLGMHIDSIFLDYAAARLNRNISSQLPDSLHHRVAEQPGLPALALDVRVVSVEGVPDALLRPAHQQLILRVAKEAAHVGTCTAQAQQPTNSQQGRNTTHEQQQQ